MSTNVYNFGAGPATLPKIVIDKITDRLGNFTDGMSIMEISHRSSAFRDFAFKSEKNIYALIIRQHIANCVISAHTQSLAFFWLKRTLSIK